MLPYIKLMRPQTLIAIIAPTLIAFKLSLREEGTNIEAFWVCFTLGLMIQILTNIFNDIVDGKNGVDAIRTGDTRYYGSSDINQNIVNALIALLLLGSFLLILYLSQIHYLFLPLGLVSLYLTYGYTGGFYPLAYNGLGEIFVYIFFGIFAFNGTFYSITNSINEDSIKLSSLYGILSILIIYANNYRDKDNDKKFSKKTLAVKFESSAKLIFIIFLLISIFHKVYLFPNLIYLLIPELFIFGALIKKINKQKIFKFCILNLFLTTLGVYFAI